MKTLVRIAAVLAAAAAMSLIGLAMGCTGWVMERGANEVAAGMADSSLFAKLQWTRGGADYSAAVRDARVSIFGVAIVGKTQPTLVYSGNGLSDWPAKSDNITHVWCLFFDDDRDGIYERGGKFDWGRSSAAPRPLHHVDRKYSNWDGYPKSGTPWAGVIVDITGRKRSNVEKGVWP